MKIEGTPGQPLPRAYLWLTKAEATELRDTLSQMIDAGPDPDRHQHVTSDAYQTEVTIAWHIE
ncbi:MAG: hypothetical protein ACJ735_06255 [Actinomycetes bacterium]